MASTLNNKEYRPEIDGLRAIAILSVVLYHAGVGPVSGFAGVDVFFVISGYLITWLLVQEKQEHGKIDLLGFYARRVRRIMPAAVVVIVATVALSHLLLPDAAREQVSRSAISGIFFFANLFFLHHSGGYFDTPSAELPLIHLWSLSVEEQFYLIWPLILIAITRLQAKAGKVVIIALMLTSFAFAEYLLATAPEGAFYAMPARFWELAFGSFVAFLPAQASGRKHLALVALAAIAIGLAIPLTHFPAGGAAPVVLGTAALIWMIHRGENLGLVGACLRCKPINLLGRISYSLYLWHWPLLALYHASSVGVTVRGCLLLCACAVILSVFSYRYIEMPFRSLTVHGRRALFLIVGGVLSMCLALVITAIDKVTTSPAVQAGLTTGNVRTPSPKVMDYATTVENDKIPYRYRCSISEVYPPDYFPPSTCASQPDVTPRVGMLGDSFATAWQPIAWEIAESKGLSAIDYSRTACPAFLGAIDDGKPLKDARCQAFNQNAVAHVKGFDTIVIATRWDARPLKVDEDGIRTMLEALAPTVGKIYLLGPSPTLHDTVPKCIRANDLDACALSRIEFESKVAPLRAFLISLSTRFNNVEYVELSDFLCTRKECPAIKDGVALYNDAAHVSYTAARKFSAEFVKGKK